MKAGKGKRQRDGEEKSSARETRCQPGNRRMVSPRRCVTRANNERRVSKGGETDRQAREKRGESDRQRRLMRARARQEKNPNSPRGKERESREKRKGNANEGRTNEEKDGRRREKRWKGRKR